MKEVEKNKQGLIIWLSLPKEGSRNIEQLIWDCIDMEDLRKEDGLDKLIEALKNTVQQEEEIEEIEAAVKRDTRWRRLIGRLMGDSKEVTEDDKLGKGRITEVKAGKKIKRPINEKDRVGTRLKCG